jgi:hypothetical protein
LEEIYILGKQNHPYIIMEFCEKGDLHSFLYRVNGKNLPENVVWKFFI